MTLTRMMVEWITEMNRHHYVESVEIDKSINGKYTYLYLTTDTGETFRNYFDGTA